MTHKQKHTLYRILVGISLFISSLFLPGCWKIGATVATWLIVGYDVLWSALRNILRGQIFDEKFLMTLATCCALAMQEWTEAAAVMLFFQVGELFEKIAVERSRRSISGLMDLRPDYAVLIKEGQEIAADPEEVEVGDILLVRPGERIPVDGVVESGESELDTSKITGEAMPQTVSAGSKVLSGCVNISGVLKIRAESLYEHSTVARILALVESAAEKKAATERMITKFARYYTPSVIAAAVLLACLPPLLLQQPFTQWLTRALSFLVISCPCALVISVPLSFFAGMGAAAKLGIVVKGGVALEQLAKTSSIVFDKTGTLTSGAFCVQSVEPAQQKDEILRLAALCERYSNHPLARAILASYPSPQGEVSNIREIPGNGIMACIDGSQIALGNRKLMEMHGITLPVAKAAGTHLYLSSNGEFLGTITVSDNPREETVSTLHSLQSLGIERLVMLTGDNEAAAVACAVKCEIPEIYAELLPQDKVNRIEEMRAVDPQDIITFVGDGVNDAPVLTIAEVGISMGGVGSDAAVEAADAVILNDDISKLPHLLRLARRTCRIAKQNIIFALGIKGLCLILGALGLASMWLAVFADVGVAVLAILNALRAMKVRS